MHNEATVPLATHIVSAQCEHTVLHGASKGMLNERRFGRRLRRGLLWWAGCGCGGGHPLLFLIDVPFHLALIAALELIDILVHSARDRC